MHTTLKDTTGMCLELRYWLKKSSEITVIVRGVDHLEQQLEHRILTEVHKQPIVKLPLMKLASGEFPYGTCTR